MTLPDMCGVLLRLRTYPIVILVNVEKAFLQIGIQQKERDVTRFLWFHDPQQPDQVEGNIDIYRFCCVPFGIVCSLFLLEGTLKFHLKSENSSVANKLLRICLSIMLPYEPTQLMKPTNYLQSLRTSLERCQ